MPAVAAAATTYLRTVNVEYVLTDRNCYRKRGVLSTRVTRVGLANVQRTALQKNVWGNLFDYGTVSLSTAGSEGSICALPTSTIPRRSVTNSTG
ncbi:PH domain-containing protein [Haloplanus litoreus]|uniref:PH domain-containing protein n=1 Tax=Haloplanus litoreus TaxID=767515 RepID=UPI003609256D